MFRCVRNKTVRFLFLGMVYISMISSCYTTVYDYVSLQSEYSRLYVGCTKAQIIADFGVPDRTENIDSNIKVLIYDDYNTLAMGMDGFGVARNFRTFAEFYMDINGKCYSVKTNCKKRIERRVPIWDS